MLSAEDISSATSNRESVSVQENLSYSSADAARLKSCTLTLEPSRQKLSYSIAAEPQALKLRLSRVSSAVREYDYPESSNIYAMISDSQIHLEAPPPTPAPRTPCHPSPSPPPPPKGGVLRRCLVVGIVSVLLILLIVSLVAGVLSLVIHFTGFIACNCPTGSTTAVQRIDGEVEMLKGEVQELREMLAVATSTSETTPPTAAGETTPPSTSSTTTPTPESPSFIDIVTLSGLDLFQDCTTSIEGTCTIRMGTTTGSRNFIGCATDLMDSVRPGEYVLNIQCLIVEETTDNNPIITTLDIVDNQGFCRCFVATLNAASTVNDDVTCGMQVTRCTVPTNITARILI